MEYDPEAQNIKKILALVRENNEMLRDMEGRRQRAMFFKFLYWIILIGLLAGAYVYVKPWLERLKTVYLDAAATIDEIGTASSQLLGNDKKQ